MYYAMWVKGKCFIKKPLYWPKSWLLPGRSYCREEEEFDGNCVGTWWEIQPPPLQKDKKQPLGACLRHPIGLHLQKLRNIGAPHMLYSIVFWKGQAIRIGSAHIWNVFNKLPGFRVDEAAKTWADNVYILSACLPFCQRFQRAGRQNPRCSRSCARPICEPFLSFFFMNRSLYLQSSAWLCVCCRRDYPLTVDSSLFLFSVAVCRGEKKGLNLIHFLTWRKTRTKKTTEFLELCGRVLSLILSRYVSDSIWTIVKISWRGIYAKSFRVRQSSVDTPLVDFLENRNAAFSFHSHESFRVSEDDFIATRCR
jgi:hypothetical protein